MTLETEKVSSPHYRSGWTLFQFLVSQSVTLDTFSPNFCTGWLYRNDVCEVSSFANASRLPFERSIIILFTALRATQHRLHHWESSKKQKHNIHCIAIILTILIWERTNINTNQTCKLFCYIVHSYRRNNTNHNRRLDHIILTKTSCSLFSHRVLFRGRQL